MAKFVYHGTIYSKKNSKSIVTNRHTGKPMVVSSKNARAMEHEMALQFRLQRNGFVAPKPCSVTIFIWRPDNVRRDLDNAATSCMDGLVKGGILDDDDFSHVGSICVADMGIDKSDPRAEIEIEECDTLES